MRVVSRWCRCIVQRLCATDCKRPCLVRAAAPHSAPARTPGVYAQRLCTMQSQQSIHSSSPRGRGLGIGIINLQFVLNTNFKSGRLPLCKYIQVLLQYLLYILTAPVAIQQFQPSFQHFLFIIIFLHKPYIYFLLTFHKHFRTTNLQYLTSPSKCREKSLQNLSVLAIV